MAKVFLRRTRETKVRAGHPWIYSSEIDRVEGAFENGDIVEVYSSKGAFYGRGFYNPASVISLRMLTLSDEECGREFFRKRVKDAVEYRRKLCDINSCRLIFSESDFLPGLVVDKFGDYLSVQILTLGMDRLRGMMVELLVEAAAPKGVYERSDVPVRRHEGLEQRTGLLWGEVPERVDMYENGLLMSVDIINGQKTGYFLDQKQNRGGIKPFCAGARVLDCFCHNGSFSLHAAKYGASDVLGVDISEEALETARYNARRNGLDNVRFEAHNCFDYLRELTDAGEKFGLVILDPPAFTKSKSTVESALRGYKEINLRGLKLVESGGFLVTCSCSQHISDEMFLGMVNEAVRDSKKRVRLIEERTQAIDHPILPAAGETKYLKCLYLQVL